MARHMSDDERRAFLSEGGRTGVLSTVRADGTPHAAPIWFVLDGDDTVFTTGEDTVKGRNLARTHYATLTVDEERPPFSFVTVGGPVALSEDLDEMLPWAVALGARYMGAGNGEQFGRRNAVRGELLARLTPQRTVAMAAIAD